MKKHTAAFIISAVVFSLGLQAVFAFYFIKTTDLNRFIYIRKNVEKNTRLSLAAADSYMDFKKSSSTAILAMPSCSLEKTLIPGKFDFFVMHSAGTTAVFSIYPSALSARKHASLYMKNVNSLEYSYSGGLFGFKCSVNRSVYSRNFFITADYSMLPSGTEAF